MKSILLFVSALVSSAFAAVPDNERGLLTLERVLESHRYCQRLCQLTPGCRNDPHAHGSYCKLWQNPPVCFGLYHLPRHHHHEGLMEEKAEDGLIEAGEILGDVEEGFRNDERGLEHHHHRVRFCFEPFSRRCDDSKLRPVRCGFFIRP